MMIVVFADPTTVPRWTHWPHIDRKCINSLGKIHGFHQVKYPNKVILCLEFNLCMSESESEGVCWLVCLAKP